MIVLDTNVVSELTRNMANPAVVGWVDSWPATEVLITAVSAAELRYGVARLPAGRRQRELEATIEALLTEDFCDQVLPFDAAASTHYAYIVATRERAGHPIGTSDAQIAAICRNWNIALATRNTKDFAATGIDLVNPWDPASQP